MNSCMRQQGQMGGMRGGCMPGGNSQRMETYPQERSMDAAKEECRKYPIGMSYVPWQKWREVVDGAKGLAQGTIFNELCLDFGCANKNCGNPCISSKLPPDFRVQNAVKCPEVCGYPGRNGMRRAEWK